MKTLKAVLLVDDEVILLLALKSLLKTELGPDIRYETAMNAGEAMVIVDELLSEGVELACVVSDWLMPGMKGDQLLFRIHDVCPTAGLILLTGQVDEQAIAAMAANPKLIGCVSKPWRGSELTALIRSCLA